MIRLMGVALVAGLLVARPAEAGGFGEAMVVTGGGVGAICVLGGPLTIAIAGVELSQDGRIDPAVRGFTAAFGIANLVAGGLLLGFAHTGESDGEQAVLYSAGGVLAALGLAGGILALAAPVREEGPGVGGGRSPLTMGLSLGF